MNQQMMMKLNDQTSKIEIIVPSQVERKYWSLEPIPEYPLDIDHKPDYLKKDRWKPSMELS